VTGFGQPSYVVVTPCRDEEEHLEGTIVSMVAQTVRPTQWIIVNDGSTDGTGEILERYASLHPWIVVVERVDRGHRLNGSGVMHAVHDGLSRIDIESWDFLVKLDADLVFEPAYFEECLARFGADSSLGIGGGVVASEVDGRLIDEKHPKFHVRGATKIYRRACWAEIGGLHVVKGWDTLDELKANMEGWSTRSFEDLVVVQKRYTGAAQGQLSNWRKNGEGCWIAGYHPLFLIVRAFVRGFRRPLVIPTVGLISGYFGAALRRTPRISDRELIRYVRRQQIRKLTGRSSAWN
jgi:poly-beta-1,6-N-acetyl-D-glucosamine synthase